MSEWPWPAPTFAGQIATLFVAICFAAGLSHHVAASDEALITSSAGFSRLTYQLVDLNRFDWYRPSLTLPGERLSKGRLSVHASDGLWV
jgi:hypothetical protein